MTSWMELKMPSKILWVSTCIRKTAMCDDVMIVIDELNKHNLTLRVFLLRLR